MNKKSRVCFASLALCAVVFSFTAVSAIAQDYPKKPINFIVPFSTGGTTDLLSRLIGDNLRSIWGQPVLVENRPGAGGRLATETLAKAAPDGYTLGLVSSIHSIHPSAFKKLPYDPVNDFEAITLVASSPQLLVVHPSLPVKSVEELIKLAKSKPGKLNFGSAGVAEAGHLAGELMKTVAGVDIMHVPFKGGGECTTALLGGHVEMSFGSIPNYISHVKAGTLRALAVTSAKRSALMPDVPTMVESGLPGLVIVQWYGVLAPARIPRPIVTKLNTEIVKILKMPDVRTRLLSLGLEPTTSTPEEFGEYIKSEIAKFRQVLKSAGVQPE